MSIFLGAVSNQYKQIIDDLNNNDKVSYGNEVAGWFATARKKDKLFIIYYTLPNEKDVFYKNAESWAKRITQLFKRGY
jgi:hypothetical protein